MWQKVSWEGTPTKKSFFKELTVIYELITKVISKTYPECLAEYCSAKIKTYIRHANERVQRKTATSKKQNPENQQENLPEDLSN